jgi:hypothetical protein
VIATTFLGGVKLSYDETTDTMMLGHIVMTGELFRQWTAISDWRCEGRIEGEERVVVMRRPDTTLIPASRRSEIVG